MPVIALDQVLSILRQYETLLAEKYGVAKLAVFGSVARGDASPQSDIDILVELSRPLGLEFVDLAEELESVLGSRVDVVPKDAIKPRFWSYIEKDLKYV